MSDSFIDMAVGYFAKRNSPDNDRESGFPYKVYLQKQTCAKQLEMAALGQERTHAPQQIANCGKRQRAQLSRHNSGSNPSGAAADLN